MSVEADPVPCPHRRSGTAMDPGRGARRRPGRGDVGGYLTADALGEVRGGAVAVNGSVRVTPFPVGARRPLDRSRPDPPDERSTSLDVAALPFDGTDVDLLRRYVDNILEPDAEQFRVSEEVEPVRLASGLTGSRIAYVGLFGDVQAPIEGEVTAVVSPTGQGVIFDGWAPAGQLQFEIDEIDAMIERAEIA